MELDWLDDYDVDACMIVGMPGTVGFTGVANILTGKTDIYNLHKYLLHKLHTNQYYLHH